MAAPATQPAAGGGILGALRQRLGPLPAWAYLLIITAALGAWYLWDKHKAGKTPPAAADQQAAAGEVTGAQDVPDYIFNSTTNVTVPPGSPPLPAPGPSPGPGPGPGKPPPVPPPSGRPHPSPDIPVPLPSTPSRHVADGSQSLAGIAKARHTTVAHLVAASEQHLDARNLAAFRDYLRKSPKGTARLPRGLIWWGSN